MIFDILTIIPNKKKRTQSGWYSFNGICCHHRGHNQDKRGRSGIKFDGNNWSIHCFNCGFKCGFTLGKSISKSCAIFLSWCGVEPEQIAKYNLQSLQQKDLIDFAQTNKKKLKVKFEEFVIKDGELIDENNPNHQFYINYLKSRKLSHKEYPFMVTPYAEGRYKNRIIIPYAYKNKIVGQTSRFLDNKFPKYINEQQQGYVFGLDFQKPEWQVCILVEGVFDALSINGCAILHNDISELQAQLLSSLQRQIIFVPDRDTTGLEVCNKALDLGYKISLPNWDRDVKDVNDAVCRYGKLATLCSILANTTTSKVKLEMYKRKL